MHDRHLMLPSDAMGRQVHLWCYGHFGPPVVVFPTAAGFAHEWKQHGLIDLLRPLLDAGRLKLYCPESNVAEAWTRRERPASWRIERHLAYERFVLDTLVPMIRQDCRTADVPLACVGASLGAMYAANFALKHPTVFRSALCLSGRYLATAFTDGYQDESVYFNNPLAYVPGLTGPALELVRNTHLTLVCGRGKYEEGCIEETIALGRVLEHKQIPSVVDIWDHEAAHDWSWWRRQLVQHLGGTFGQRVGIAR